MQQQNNFQQQDENPEGWWFGHQASTPENKIHQVRGVFQSVARRYDAMNDVMSFGLHRQWRQQMVKWAAPRPNDRVADVAGGTADIAWRLLRAGAAQVTLLDLTPDMLVVGRDRMAAAGYGHEIIYAAADAACLPLPDMAMDLITIAFGLRNVARIDSALAEFHRVLAPGGRFVCLELSPALAPWLAKPYQLWVNEFVPRFGAIMVQDRTSYDYLRESIQRFPAPAQLAERMEKAGFRLVRHQRLAGGIVALHKGYRL